MDDFGLDASTLDQTLWSLPSPHVLFVLIQAENCLITGKEPDLTRFIDFMKNRFTVGSIEWDTFELFGTKFTLLLDGTRQLDQNAKKYEFGPFPAYLAHRPADARATALETRFFAYTLGSMIFIGCLTTPLLNFYASFFGSRTKKLTVTHVKHLSSAVLQSRKWDFSLRYPPATSEVEPTLLVFTDASHYLDPKKHMQAHLGIMITRAWGTCENDVHHPIDFATHGLRREAVFAKGDESQAAYAGAGTVQILRHLKTLFSLTKPRRILVTDNKSLVSRIIENRRLNDGYVTLDMLALRKNYKFGEFGAMWASEKQMVADSLTKPNALNDDHRAYLNTGRIQFALNSVLWHQIAGLSHNFLCCNVPPCFSPIPRQQGCAETNHPVS